MRGNLAKTEEHLKTLDGLMLFSLARSTPTSSARWRITGESGKNRRFQTIFE